MTNNMFNFDMSNVDIRDAFFNKIYDIASNDKNVIFMTADADAFSLKKYKKDFPNQFMNVGVSEQNLINVASGLALSGKKVFIYTIIPFITMRCYEHIKVNICSMNLPVTIIGTGSGLSFGNDGPTHHAIQDISIMRTLPEITILNPIDSSSAVACANLSYKNNSPTYVRLDKGTFNNIYNDKDNYSDGLKIIKELSDINVISTGYMTQQATKIANQLKNYSINIGIVDVYRLKPVNDKALLKIINMSKYIVTIEENSIVGGLGTIVSEIMTDNNTNTILKRIAIPDVQCFAYGSREWLHEKYKIDIDNIVKYIRKLKVTCSVRT